MFKGQFIFPCPHAKDMALDTIPDFPLLLYVLSTTLLNLFLGYVCKLYRLSALLVQCAMIMLSMVFRPVLKGLQHVSQGSTDCAYF